MSDIHDSNGDILREVAIRPHQQTKPAATTEAWYELEISARDSNHWDRIPSAEEIRKKYPLSRPSIWPTKFATIEEAQSVKRYHEMLPSRAKYRIVRKTLVTEVVE